MKSRFFTTTIAIVLTIALITPSAFLVAPQRAHAIPVAVAEDLPTWLNTGISVIRETITSIAAVTSDAALIALKIKAFVLDPLAFVVSGNLLKAITKGTIEFVIGKLNGTGLPQFVADIQRSAQTVSDARSLAFFQQYIRSSQSPYAGSVIAALSKEYLNKSSLLGFWEQNMDTLRRTSPNPYGFLSGVWAPGDTATWFALVTQTQNNPYGMYTTAQSKLGSILGPGVAAVEAKLHDIASGRGFVSWCGPTDGFLGSVATLTTSTAAAANAAAVDQAGDVAYKKVYDKAIADGDPPEEAKTLAEIAKSNARVTAFNKAKAENAGNSVLGVAPGDPCTNADGTTGTVQTPGSVIAASLNKALGGQQDQVTRMGDVGGQINTILSNIAVVLKTVQFGSQILGGEGSRGLLGVNQRTSGQDRSALQAYANSSGNLGVTESTVLKNAATLPSSGSDMLDRVSQYETAINTLKTPANTAATSVTSLLAYCVTQQQVASSTLQTGNPIDLANLATFTDASAAQISATQTAFGTLIAPVITRVNTASTTIVNARALVQKIQTELTSGTAADITASTADLETLRTLPPTLNDLAVAQQDTSVSGASVVVADPPGSLNVSGGFLIDRLNLISANATALQPSCTAPAPAPVAPTPIPPP